MYSNKNKSYLSWIKEIILILLFLFVPFYLNKYFPPEFKPELSIPFPLPEISITEPEPEEIIELPMPVPEKITEAAVYIESLPIPVPSIQIEVPAEEIDIFQIAQEMKSLHEQLPSGYEARKFYIPPVKYKPELKEMLIPAGMIALGALATHTDKFKDFIPGLRKNPKNRATPFDDEFQKVPSASLFVFDLFFKEKHHVIDQMFLMAISYGITVLPVRIIKNNYDAARPYGGNNSFPSGHTATAFVGAHIIYKEFKDTNPWVAYSGYAMASVVAGARVVNDKHWVCDVLAGAGIAMLSTELAYLIYFPARNLVTNGINKLVDKYIILTPVIHPQAVGLHLSFQF